MDQRDTHFLEKYWLKIRKIKQIYNQPNLVEIEKFNRNREKLNMMSLG